VWAQSAESGPTARTLEEKRPVGADFLRSIGLSNGCTVRGGVHRVVVVGDLLRRHCLMVVRRKLQTGGNAKRKVYIGGVGWISFAGANRIQGRVPKLNAYTLRLPNTARRPLWALPSMMFSPLSSGRRQNRDVHTSKNASPLWENPHICAGREHYRMHWDINRSEDTETETGGAMGHGNSH
jgi:hypothetical protein